LSYESADIKLVNEQSDCTKIIIDEKEDKTVRLDVTEIVN